MRSWHPIPPICLDRKRLLGEHNELHIMWSVITKNKKGYRSHPETQRWIGHLAALAHRHELIVSEMTERGYNHKSPLADVKLFAGPTVIFPYTIEPLDVMRKKLSQKIAREVS